MILSQVLKLGISSSPVALQTSGLEKIINYIFLFSYLQCVSKNMKKLQPFGDVPKKLSLQLRRSFVATRTFSQALIEGKKILTKVLKIAPKDKCVEAMTRMMSCPSCQGLPAIRPCSGYCHNVMNGCLAHHTELADSWDRFIGEHYLYFCS